MGSDLIDTIIDASTSIERLARRKAIKPLILEKLQKRGATRHNMINYRERTRGNDLALSVDV
jgi:hypothetical protein